MQTHHNVFMHHMSLCAAQSTVTIVCHNHMPYTWSDIDTENQTIHRKGQQEVKQLSLS
jgi:hypothetical protein